MTSRPLPQFARFWMICRKPTGPNTKTEPRQRYSHRQDAEQDAARLASETGAKFLILEAVAVVDPVGDPQSGLI